MAAMVLLGPCYFGLLMNQLTMSHVVISLSVGDAFIVLEGSEYDFNAILLRIELKFLSSEQLICCGEVTTV